MKSVPRPASSKAARDNGVRDGPHYIAASRRVSVLLAMVTRGCYIRSAYLVRFSIDCNIDGHPRFGRSFHHVHEVERVAVAQPTKTASGNWSPWYPIIHPIMAGICAPDGTSPFRPNQSRSYHYGCNKSSCHNTLTWCGLVVPHFTLIQTAAPSCG